MNISALLPPLISAASAVALSALLVIAPGTTASATPIVDQATGLASPDVVVDFGVGLYAPGTPITNQFAASGVTFGPDFLYNSGGSAAPATVDGYLQPNGPSTLGSVFFTADVSAAGFSLRTVSGTSSFEAYLDGSLVESFIASTDLNSTTARFYGFEGIVFDELRFDPNDGGFFFDNLQFTVVPEPSTALLVGLGMAGLARARRQ